MLEYRKPLISVGLVYILVYSLHSLKMDFLRGPWRQHERAERERDARTRVRGLSSRSSSFSRHRVPVPSIAEHCSGNKPTNRGGPLLCPGRLFPHRKRTSRTNRQRGAQGGLKRQEEPGRCTSAALCDPAAAWRSLVSQKLRVCPSPSGGAAAAGSGLFKGPFLTQNYYIAS